MGGFEHNLLYRVKEVSASSSSVAWKSFDGDTGDTVNEQLVQFSLRRGEYAEDKFKDSDLPYVAKSGAAV